MSAGKQLQGMPDQTRTISLMWVFVAMLVLLDWAAVARAQDAAPAPAGTRSLAPTPFQLTLPRAHLLGDWYGLRPWLEDHGITPTLTFVTDALGNPTGGREQGFTGAHNLGLDLLFDLEKLADLRGGSFLFSMSERFGTSLSGQYIGNVFTVQ
jgi:porin